MIRYEFSGLAQQIYFVQHCTTYQSKHNWQDYKFFRPSQDAVYKYIDPLFKDVIDWQLIQTHWQDLMRVVLSVKAGKILPSTLLQKLGSYSRKNRLYQAFRELGYVVRTVYS